MASSPTSPEFTFRNEDGEPLDVPQEWTPAVIELPLAPERWPEARLVLNDVELPIVASRRWEGERVLAEWPRSGPGNYVLRLSAGEIQIERAIHVASSKLGDTGVAALIEDLEHHLPASIALSLSRAGALAGIRLQPPGANTAVQEALRLLRAIRGAGNRPGLGLLLPLIGGAPHQVLAAEERWVQREWARRVSASRLVQALAVAGNLDADDRPIRVIDTRTQDTVDTHENRLLKLYASEVDRRLRRLIGMSASLPADVANELAGCRQELRDARRRARFLDDVSQPAYLPDRVTMVLLKEPRYRAVLDGYLDFHRSIWALFDDDALDAPLTNLPYLYETWGTLHVVDALLEVALDAGFTLRRERLIRRTHGSVFVEVLRAGESVVELIDAQGRTLDLTPQRSFGAAGRFRSVSYLQRPDVTVERARSDALRTLLLFDPKYKLDSEDTEEGTGKPVKGDVDKMHAYRDAIVDRDNARIVAHAATLYPGETVRFGSGVAAIQATPERSTDLAVELRRAVSALIEG